MSDSGNPDRDRVAGTHELLRIAAHPGPAAGTAAHQVARLQCDRLRQELEKRWDGRIMMSVVVRCSYAPLTRVEISKGLRWGWALHRIYR
jgi:hypothetical protein